VADESAQPEVTVTRFPVMDNIAHWCFQHWLLILNTLVLLYAGIPWLSPLLIELGFVGVGNALFAIYAPLCHQSPTNSPYLFGHQVAFCNREAAMYTALVVGGLLYAGGRHWLVRRPLAKRWLLLLLLPLLLDGTSQTVDALMPGLGLRDPNDAPFSLNWWLRIVSGVLAAAAVVLIIYPRLDRDLRGLGEQNSANDV
jgi:uncharacterized membrane protein